MLAFLKKYGLHYHLSQGILAFLLCLALYFNLLHPNIDKDVQRLEKTFQAKINYLDASLDEFSNAVNYGDKLDIIWDNTRKFRNLGYEYFVFENDSLLYWTSNQVVLRKAQMQDLNRAVLLLENGWYALSTKRAGDYTMIGLFLIKNEYPYENENLINAFNSDLSFPYKADIQLFEDAKNIRYPNNDFAFSVAKITQNKPGIFMELLLFFGFLSAIVKIGLGLWRSMSKSRLSIHLKMLLAFFSILWLRLFFYWVDWKSYFPDFELFNPNIFASSVLSPTLGDLIINTIALVVMVHILTHFAKLLSRKSMNRTETAPLSFAAHLLVFFGLSHISIQGIAQTIFNSDVSLEFYNFMSLSPVSFLFLGIFFALLWAYYRMSVALLLQAQIQKIPVNTQGALWFLCAVAFLIFEILSNKTTIWVSLFPMIFSLILLYYNRIKRLNFQFTEVIALLALFSLFLSVLINHTQNQKELSTREVYAKKLISEKELETELEYAYTAALLQESALLQNFFQNPDLK